MRALAEVPDACTGIGAAIDVTETVAAGAEETGGTELSKLFLIRQGGMTAEELQRSERNTERYHQSTLERAANE